MEELKPLEPTPKKKPNIVVRFLAFLVTLALLLGAVALVVFRDQLNFDALKRYFTYRSLERSDTGQTESFEYDSGGKGGFDRVGDDLLVWSTTGVRLYSAGGVAYLNESLSFHRPVADVGGDSAVIYDAGGNTLRLYAKRAEVLALDTAQGKEILSARLSPSGQLTVTSREPGFKGVVTVYGLDGAPVVGLRISSQFVMDGLISADGKTVAVLTAGQENDVFRSGFSFYTLDGDAPFASCSLGNNVILDAVFSDGAFWALGESGLSAAGTDGTLKGSYDYAGRYLKDYSLEGDGFAALLLGKYRAGSGATLVTVDAAGKEVGTLELEDQVLDLAAAGRYVAVLTAGSLDLYTRDLKPYASLDNTGGARNVVLRPDGTAFLIGADAARLFIPD